MDTKKFSIGILFIIFLSSPALWAQELTVKSFREADHDLAARTHAHKDMNGNYCALLKVQLVASEAQFDGNVIGDVAFKNNEYWVYMAQGSKRLKVYHQDYLPLEVTFSDYGINHLDSRCTYVLTLLRSDIQQENLSNLKKVSKRRHTKKVKDSVDRISKHLSDSPKVYNSVKEMPKFPGGSSALSDYISKNIIYPKIAEKNGIEGRVLLSFVVEPDGSITNVKVVKSIDPSLDKEAERVVSFMPKWIPGKQNGLPVRVRYKVPVEFNLPRNKRKDDMYFYKSPKINRR